MAKAKTVKRTGKVDVVYANGFRTQLWNDIAEIRFARGQAFTPEQWEDRQAEAAAAKAEQASGPPPADPTEGESKNDSSDADSSSESSPQDREGA